MTRRLGPIQWGAVRSRGLVTDANLAPLECGGKRSATPLWILTAFISWKSANYNPSRNHGGVALRLPPHSTNDAIVRTSTELAD
jgi:hypothetical protein